MPSTVACSKVKMPRLAVSAPLLAVASHRGFSKVNSPPKTLSRSAVTTA